MIRHVEPRQLLQGAVRRWAVQAPLSSVAHVAKEINNTNVAFYHVEERTPRQPNPLVEVPWQARPCLELRRCYSRIAQSRGLFLRQMQCGMMR